MSKAKRIEKWVWILIYGGMFALALGLSVLRVDASLGWAIAVPGGLLIVAGIVLIWARSRMNNTEETP